MKRTGVAIVGLILAMVAGSSAGERFKTSLNAGLTMTDGNSRTRQGNLALVTEAEWEDTGSLRAGGVLNYGDSKIDGERETTLDNARIFANAKRTITPRTYGGVDILALYDDVARIDYRVILGPSVGVYMLKTDSAKLSLDLGIAYLWEDVDDRRDDYLAARLAQRLEVVISETAKVWQAADYVPKADDFEDYLLSAEVGAEAAMNARLSLRVVLQGQYDATPAADVKRTDVSLVSGLRLAL